MNHRSTLIALVFNTVLASFLSGVETIQCKESLGERRARAVHWGRRRGRGEALASLRCSATVDL